MPHPHSGAPCSPTGRSQWGAMGSHTERKDHHVSEKVHPNPAARPASMVSVCLSLCLFFSLGLLLVFSSPSVHTQSSHGTMVDQQAAEQEAAADDAVAQTLGGWCPYGSLAGFWDAGTSFPDNHWHVMHPTCALHGFIQPLVSHVSQLREAQRSAQNDSAADGQASADSTQQSDDAPAPEGLQLPPLNLPPRLTDVTRELDRLAAVASAMASPSPPTGRTATGQAEGADGEPGEEEEPADSALRQQQQQQQVVDEAAQAQLAQSALSARVLFLSDSVDRYILTYLCNVVEGQAVMINLDGTPRVDAPPPPPPDAPPAYPPPPPPSPPDAVQQQQQEQDQLGQQQQQQAEQPTGQSAQQQAEQQEAQAQEAGAAAADDADGDGDDDDNDMGAVGAGPDPGPQANSRVTGSVTRDPAAGTAMAADSTLQGHAATAEVASSSTQVPGGTFRSSPGQGKSHLGPTLPLSTTTDAALSEGVDPGGQPGEAHLQQQQQLQQQPQGGPAGSSHLDAGDLHFMATGRAAEQGSGRGQPAHLAAGSAQPGSHHSSRAGGATGGATGSMLAGGAGGHADGPAALSHAVDGLDGGLSEGAEERRMAPRQHGGRMQPRPGRRQRPPRRSEGGQDMEVFHLPDHLSQGTEDRNSRSQAAGHRQQEVEAVIAAVQGRKLLRLGPQQPGQGLGLGQQERRQLRVSGPLDATHSGAGPLVHHHDQGMRPVHNKYTRETPGSTDPGVLYQASGGIARAQLGVRWRSQLEPGGVQDAGSSGSSSGGTDDGGSSTAASAAAPDGAVAAAESRAGRLPPPQRRYLPTVCVAPHLPQFKLMSTYIPGVHPTGPYHRGVRRGWQQQVVDAARLWDSMTAEADAKYQEAPFIVVLGSCLWDLARMSAYEPEAVSGTELSPALLEAWAANFTHVVKGVRAALPRAAMLVYHTTMMPRFDPATGVLDKRHLGRRLYISQLNAAGKQVAASLGLEVVDYAALANRFMEGQSYLADAIHPGPGVGLEVANLLLNYVHQVHERQVQNPDWQHPSMWLDRPTHHQHHLTKEGTPSPARSAHMRRRRTPPALTGTGSGGRQE